MFFFANVPMGRFPKPFPTLVKYSLCWISQYVTVVFYFKYRLHFPSPFFKQITSPLSVPKVLQHKKSNPSSDILECNASV